MWGIYTKAEHGLTLTELLITMAISGILMGAIVSSFISQQRSYALQGQVSEMVQNAQAALGIMSREIRMVGYNPTNAAGDAGIDGIPSATDFALRADLNGDGDTNDPHEWLAYRHDAGNLKIDRQTQNGGFQPFVENIQALTFTYLNAAGNPLAFPIGNSALIRQVQIDITARTAASDPNYADNNGYRTFRLTSRVYLRNLL